MKRQVESERLPIDRDRLEAIPLGTEHLSEDERAESPAELLLRGFIDQPFVLCVGTDYSHKNRDMALLAMDQLSSRGWTQALVIVGPAVPHGSSRVAEAFASLVQRVPGTQGQVFVLPEVPSAERNWLFKQTCQLFSTRRRPRGSGSSPTKPPSSVTPTVFVGFGPLRELAPDLPVTAAEMVTIVSRPCARALVVGPWARERPGRVHSDGGQSLHVVVHCRAPHQPILPGAVDAGPMGVTPQRWPRRRRGA